MRNNFHGENLDDFGIPHFVFRDPEDVFKEFFGGRDPFEELFDRKYPLNFKFGEKKKKKHDTHALFLKLLAC